MRTLDPRWKGTLAAVLLFGLGTVAGVAGDRIWLGLAPTVAEAAPLTPDGMATALHLDAAQGARVRAVLDSLQSEVARGAAEGPDSLRVAAERARRRLENALPPDRRPQFQQWMQQHHDRMMRRMRGGAMGGGGMMGRGMGPRMTAPDTTVPPGQGRGGQRRGGRRGGAMMGGGMMGPDSGGGGVRR